VYFVQIQCATGCQCAQEVDSGCTLIESLYHSLRVGDAFFSCEPRSVDDISAVTGQLQFLVLLLLERATARFRELPGTPQDLHDGATQPVHHHDAHLNYQREGIAHVSSAVLVKLGERLGTITALNDETFPILHLGQL